MRTRAMVVPVAVLVACAMLMAVHVSAHTCYFMEVPNGWDHETRMGADVMATVLSFAAATDFRVVRFGEGGDPLLSAAQFRDTVNIVGTKMATCAQANRKILINFHAQNTAKRFLRKTIVAAYLKLRADAVAHGAAALAPGVAAVVFNAFSCMPEDYTDDRVLLSYWQEVAALPAPAVHGLLLPALRDEFTTWLFGRTKAHIDVIKAARDAANAVQQCEDTLAAAQHDLDVDDTAPTVAHARAFAEAQAALTTARAALTRAQLAVQNLPAAVTNLRYAAGQPVGSIADGLVVDDGHGHAVPKVLISAPWTAHPLHNAAKVACYNAYPDNAATVAAALTATTCVLRTVYHASPDHGDQNTYPAPVLGHGHAEAPVAYRPLLQDLDVAFPDLNGHLRGIAPNANIGHKAAARILSRRVDAAAVVPNPFGPNDVMRLPNALLQYRAALRADRRAAARDLDLELDAEHVAADEEADDANADADADADAFADAEADTANAEADEADDAVDAADQ